MKRYLASLPPVTQRYSLAVLRIGGAPAIEQPLTPSQQRMLASYEGRDPEPFKLECTPVRGAFVGWRVP